MDPKEVEKKIIENYQSDEKMMVLIFCQWCVNNNLDPQELYTRAYPEQPSNPIIVEVMEENTVPKEESEVIPDATLIQVLQLFGNNDLAFIVQEELDKLNKK